MFTTSSVTCVTLRIPVRLLTVEQIGSHMSVSCRLKECSARTTHCCTGCHLLSADHNVHICCRAELSPFEIIYTTTKITSEFRNVSVTVGVVDGQALHGKQT